MDVTLSNWWLKYSWEIKYIESRVHLVRAKTRMKWAKVLKRHIYDKY